jgi:transcriptional regulator with XRE-family HTH domain
MDRFPQMLRAAIERAGMSLREFDRRVSTGNSYILGVVTGNSPVPMDKVDHWADELGIQGEAREEFKLAAALEHTPEAVRKELLRLRAVVKRLEKLEEHRKNQQQRHEQRPGAAAPAHHHPTTDPHSPTPPGSAQLPPCPC